MDIERTTRTEVVLTEIGERIRRLRIDQGMTQAELAERAGIGLRTLQRLENGTAATQLSSVIKVSQSLGLEKRLDALIPGPEMSPIALLQLKTGVRKRASGKKPTKAAGSWKWGE